MGICPEGMVFVPACKQGYKKYDLCVDQHEFTNKEAAELDRTLSNTYQLIEIKKDTYEQVVIANGKDPEKLWPVKTPDMSRGIVGYILKMIGQLPPIRSPKGFDGPDQPLVRVWADEARQFCEAQGKRLPTTFEWIAIATKCNTIDYSTKSGILDKGVHHEAKVTANVCKSAGYYIEYDGNEICDMCGNIEEYTFTPSCESSDDFYVNGGSWHSLSDGLRAKDYNIEPGASDMRDTLGFRCVSSPQQP